MQRHAQPMLAFRRRLLRLIDEQLDGRYTALARRAGIPVSTMQHYIHTAKHLPGGEHLLRLAAALGVTVEQLASGPAGVRPAARPAPLLPTVGPPRQPPPAGPATHLNLPVFHCRCPEACPLTEAVPSVAAAHARVVLPAAMLAPRQYHRLLGIEVGPRLPCADWPRGALLTLDWDDRVPPGGRSCCSTTRGTAGWAMGRRGGNGSSSPRGKTPPPTGRPGGPHPGDDHNAAVTVL